jgi:hypothetical protein
MNRARWASQPAKGPPVNIKRIVLLAIGVVFLLGFIAGLLQQTSEPQNRVEEDAGKRIEYAAERGTGFAVAGIGVREILTAVRRHFKR